MSSIEWKIEDGVLLWLGPFRSTPVWHEANAAEAAIIVRIVIASTKERCAAVADAVKLGGDDAVQKLKERGMPHEWSDGWIASADRIAAAIRSLQITATPNPKRE